jgi:hypothetical protein
MADLLSHVLVACALFTVAGWRVDRLTDEWVAVGTAGAAIPDLIKVRLVVGPGTIETLLGVPFDIDAVGTLGGVLIVAGVIALLFGERWRRAYGLLVAGGCSALVLDGMRAYADGWAGYWMYPVPFRLPTPNLYVSSDPNVLGAVLVVTLSVVALDRYAVGDAE